MHIPNRVLQGTTSVRQLDEHRWEAQAFLSLGGGVVLTRSKAGFPTAAAAEEYLDACRAAWAEQLDRAIHWERA